MRKRITVFLISLFLLMDISTIATSAQQSGQLRRFKEGFYYTSDLGLLENVSYNVQNVSEYKGFVVVFDSDQKIQQAISLDPRSQKHPLKVIRNTDRIVILGQGELTFTS